METKNQNVEVQGTKAFNKPTVAIKSLADSSKKLADIGLMEEKDYEQVKEIINRVAMKHLTGI